MIDEKLYYMIPETGCVGLGAEWLEAFKDRNIEITPTWISWGGDSLIEVEMINGEWKEVK